LFDYIFSFFRTTRITRRTDHIDLEKIKSEPLKLLLNFTTYADEQADFFNHFRVDEAFHFLGLACADKYKRKGVASKLFHAQITWIRSLGMKGVVIKGEASSNYSKLIFLRENFEVLYDLKFAGFKVNGEEIIKNTGEHTSMIVCGLRAC